MLATVNPPGMDRIRVLEQMDISKTFVHNMREIRKDWQALGVDDPIEIIRYKTNCTGTV